MWPPSLNFYNLLYRFDVTEEFFTAAVRARIIDFILRRKKFNDSENDDFAFGIEKMLSESTYEAAYPIHEVRIVGSVSPSYPVCVVSRELGQCCKIANGNVIIIAIIYSFSFKGSVSIPVSTELHKLCLFQGDLHVEGNDRSLLFKNWAALRNFYKYQPLDYVKDYFGVKIGLYFAWLGFYTYMLIPASIVGLLCFIYAVSTINDHMPR